ncbi:MAG: (2Fe-2S)-binding protein [Pseudonocardia sp.]|nr:(2Fe-2S)-binding protein [Pseudonocardia sp.]
MRAQSSPTPLTGTAMAVTERPGGLTVRNEVPSGPGWTVCADVDVPEWESAALAALPGWYGATHPTTASAFVLHWYAGVAAGVGAAFFRHARRVPRLDRGSVAFHRSPQSPIPDAYALLDERFWCLPTDPDAAHPHAAVVPDAEALAATLRAEVRAHADAFLAGYRPGSPLPRRALLGAFFDELDTGTWCAEDGTTHPADQAATLREARLVLPEGGPELPSASTLARIVDGRGREWLTRRRISCCFYYRVGADGPGATCSTCPRTSDEERLRRYTELA